MADKTNRLEEDFRVFLWLMWKYLNLPEPTKTQLEIASYLQHGPSKSVIMAFRGVGKSWITAAYVLWRLYNNPQLKILVVSASSQRAENFVRFCMRLIKTVPELKWLEPSREQRFSSIEFDVGPSLPDQTPSVFARGITSQLTGGRADIIVPDDIEVPTNSFTSDMREKLIERVKEFTAMLKPLPTSEVHYLGTPQTEDSIYNKLPENFERRIWPAQVPLADKVDGYGGNLAPRVTRMVEEERFGEPVDPERFDTNDLMVRRLEYGAAGYALQFQLDTSLSDEEKYPLKLKDLVVDSVPPDKAPNVVNWLPRDSNRLTELTYHGMRGDRLHSAYSFGDMVSEYQLRGMSIDPSGRGQDETGYAVGFMLKGNIWIPAAGGLPGGYDEDTLRALSDMIRRHNIQQVVIESNFGDGMFRQIFHSHLMSRKMANVELLDVRHNVMKEQRIIDTLEPVISAHRLIVDPEVIKEDDRSSKVYDGIMRVQKTLTYQMTHICRERGALKFDDRLDALSMLVAHFLEVMAQDAKGAEELERQEWLEQQMKRHVAGLQQPTLRLNKDDRKSSGLWIDSI